MISDLQEAVDAVQGEEILIVDGDIVAYRFAILNTDQIDWGDGIQSTVSNVKSATNEACAFIEHLKKHCGADKVVLTFTGEDNFRHQEFLEYKANRKPEDKPEMLDKLKERLSKKFYTVKHPLLEADDVMGILQTHPLLSSRSTIATIDKDLDQIAGWHYNWNKERTYEVLKADGYRYLWEQVLTGDATDNYKGCYLVGPKGAAKLLTEDLQTPLDYFTVVWQAYCDREEARQEHHTFPVHDIKYLTSQVRCALMLTSEYFDYESNKPIMWRVPEDAVL